MSQIIALNTDFAQVAFFESIGESSTNWRIYFDVDKALADVYMHIKSLPSSLTPENHTERAYSAGLKNFMEFLGDQLPTPSLMNRYIAMLRHSGRSSTTISSKYLAPVRLFLTKLANTRRIGLKGDNHTIAYDYQDLIRQAAATKSPRAETTNYESALFAHGTRISKSKVQAILRYILNNAKNTVYGHRDYAIYVLAFSTGLRLAEIQRLTLSNFYEDEDEQWWIKVRGKRSNYTPVPVDSHVKFLVDTYVNEYNARATAQSRPTIGNDTPLWQPVLKGDHLGKLSKNGISKTCLSEIMGRWTFSAIGIRLAPHDFRRTFATIALKDGWDVVEISKALRHADVATTVKYTGIYTDQKRKTVRLV